MLLDLSNKGLTSLDGIDLTKVTALDVRNNNLTSLTKLPITLKRLHCGKNQLVHLELPPNLHELVCSHNKLTSLVCPESLIALSCNKNPIKTINFPHSIKILVFGGVDINIPSFKFDYLPESLEEFACDLDMLVRINKFPKGLTSITDIPMDEVNLYLMSKRLEEMGCVGLDSEDDDYVVSDYIKNDEILRDKIGDNPDNVTFHNAIYDKYMEWLYDAGGDKFKEAQENIAILTAQ